MVQTGSRIRSTVPRPRLHHLIDKPTLAPITLITAPAGYGKSTLVEQWTHMTILSVATVQLGPDANSLPVFMGKLAAAIDRAMDLRQVSPDPEFTLDAINARLATIGEVDSGLVIMLDDYHLIENQDVHQAMDSLIVSLPPGVSVIVVSRTVPPLTLGRLRAYGQVREVTEADLAFTQEELKAVIPDDLAPRLTSVQIERLADRTEGWIAGIRLALASMDTCDGEQVEQVIESLVRNPWLDEFLVEEVLDALPEELRSFVLLSVHMPWLEAVHCDHVLELGTSARLIGQLRRRLVFVQDGVEPDTLVYHALFAGCAQRIAEREMSVDHIRALRVRIMEWLEQQGRIELALTFAIGVEEWPDALRMARTICRDLMDRDQHHSRLHWLNQLPRQLILADSHLARGYISALQYTGRHREASRALLSVEQRWTTASDPVVQGYLHACRAFSAAIDGDVDRGLRHCYEALAAIPADCKVERMHAWSGALQFEFHRGNDVVAEQLFRQASLCRERLPGDQWWWVSVVEVGMANRRAVRGDLTTAALMLQDLITGLPAIYRSHTAKMRHRLAAILLEQNHLNEATAAAGLIQQDLDAFPHHNWYPEALLTVAQIAAATCDKKQVESMLVRVQALHSTLGGKRFQDQASAFQASLWLENGSIELAREWASRIRDQAEFQVQIFGETDPRLILVRVLIADGKYAEANVELQRLVEQATATKHWCDVVPTAMWQVVTCLALNDESGAFTALRIALHHGRKGHFVRSFITKGYDLSPFLQRNLQMLPADDAAYAQALGVQGIWSLSAPISDPVPNPLSAREMEVLGFLAQTLTNREIGEHLFISELTVKRHVRSILAKLSAGNRADAVQRARELGLISSTISE